MSMSSSRVTKQTIEIVTQIHYTKKHGPTTSPTRQEHVKMASWAGAPTPAHILWWANLSDTPCFVIPSMILTSISVEE